MKHLILLGAFLILTSLACMGGTATQRSLQLYPTEVSPTVQVIIIEITQTQISPVTPSQVVPTPISYLCVSAIETVYLRPLANLSGSPIMVLTSGQIIEDLGGRDNGFWFVKIEAQQGWVKSDYVSRCLLGD